MAPAARHRRVDHTLSGAAPVLPPGCLVACAGHGRPHGALTAAEAPLVALWPPEVGKLKLRDRSAEKPRRVRGIEAGIDPCAGADASASVDRSRSEHSERSEITGATREWLPRASAWSWPTRAGDRRPTRSPPAPDPPTPLGVQRAKRTRSSSLAGGRRCQHEGDVAAARAAAAPRPTDPGAAGAPLTSSAVPVASAAAKTASRSRSIGGRAADHARRQVADHAHRRILHRGDDAAVCAARSSSKWSCTDARHQSNSRRNSAS